MRKSRCRGGSRFSNSGFARESKQQPRPHGSRKATTLGPAEAYSDLRRVQVREENWRAMQLYQPTRFPGRITLFKAMTASDKVEWPDDYGWSGLAERRA